MTQAQTPIAEFAALLVRAHREREALPAAPLPGPADAAAAYAVQRAVWRELAGEARPIAWKVAAADRDAVPIAAPVLPQRLIGSGDAFPAGSFLAPRAEAELAVRFGRDLPARAQPYSRAEILDAVETLHVAMELVDTRLADAGAAGPFWRLADNLVNGGLVLGAAIPDWRGLDFPDMVARVRVDGVLVAETRGRPPLEDIFHCLPWWIAHAGGARAGDVVTTGAWNGAHGLTPPCGAEVEFAGLGAAAATLR